MTPAAPEYTECTFLKANSGWGDEGKERIGMMLRGRSLFSLAVVFAIMPGVAQAYIDPGSGGAIISTVIGAFVAFGLVIKGYWYKIKRLVSGRRARAEHDDKAEK